MRQRAARGQQLAEPRAPASRHRAPAQRCPRARSFRPAASAAAPASGRAAAPATAARIPAAAARRPRSAAGPDSTVPSARWRCARFVVERVAVHPSQARSRSPEGSFHGIPVACTFVPGAWPTISTRAVVETRNTGRGPQRQMRRADPAGARSRRPAPPAVPRRLRRRCHGGRSSATTWSASAPARFQRPQPDFRVQRCLVRRIDAGEIAESGRRRPSHTGPSDRAGGIPRPAYRRKSPGTRPPPPGRAPACARRGTAR